MDILLLLLYMLVNTINHIPGILTETAVGRSEGIGGRYLYACAYIVYASIAC